MGRSATEKKKWSVESDSATIPGTKGILYDRNAEGVFMQKRFQS